MFVYVSCSSTVHLRTGLVLQWKGIYAHTSNKMPEASINIIAKNLHLCNLYFKKHLDSGSKIKKNLYVQVRNKN